MWGTIISSAITVLLFVVKALIQKKNSKKLNDIELIEHITEHQKRRKGVANQAVDFETAMQEAHEKLDKKSIE
jgi:hypothetical protein